VAKYSLPRMYDNCSGVRLRRDMTSSTRAMTAARRLQREASTWGGNRKDQVRRLRTCKDLAKRYKTGSKTIQQARGPRCPPQLDVTTCYRGFGAPGRGARPNLILTNCRNQVRLGLQGEQAVGIAWTVIMKKPVHGLTARSVAWHCLASRRLARQGRAKHRAAGISQHRRSQRPILSFGLAHGRLTHPSMTITRTVTPRIAATTSLSLTLHLAR
jgi:hypothetical protein